MNDKKPSLFDGFEGFEYDESSQENSKEKTTSSEITNEKIKEENVENKSIDNNTSVALHNYLQNDTEPPFDNYNKQQAFVSPFSIEAAEVVVNQEKNIDKNEETFQNVEQETKETLPEWQLDKHYYSIGEVAAMFEVNTSHIRFWTNEFAIKPRTTKKGGRLYSPDDIKHLRLIHHLVKVKKYTIKGAKGKISIQKNQKKIENKVNLKISLTELKEILIQLRDLITKEDTKEKY